MTLGAFALALIGTVPVRALSPLEAPSTYISTHWDAETGLPHNTVLDICQTHDGYLWVGTLGGIARFDGIRFTVFNEHNTAGILNSQVTSLAETRDGSLWIGSVNGLIRFYKGEFRTYTEKDGLKTSAAIVNALCVDNDDTLWIGTRDAIMRWSNGNFGENVDTTGIDLHGLRAISADRGNGIWISLGSDVLRYAGGRLTRYGSAQGLPGSIVATVATDSLGRVMAVTHAGLYVFHDGRFSPFEHNRELASTADNYVAPDHAGNLWIGSAGGLDRYVDGKVTPYYNQSGTGIGVVYSILEDQEDGLWLGTANGLYRLTNRRGHTVAGTPELEGVVGLAVLQSHDNAIWLASYGNGVDRIDANGSVVRYRVGRPLSHETVKCIYEASDHTLWFGTRESAVDRLVGDKVTTFVYPPGVATSRPVTALFATDDDLLIGISHRGLLHLEKGAIVPVPEAADIASETVWSINRLREGRLIAGTSKGLYERLANGHWTPLSIPGVTSPVVARSMQQSADGTVWFATDGHGLVRWHNGMGRSYGTREGILDDTLFSAVDDQSGSIWVSSMHGIGRIRRSDLDGFDLGTVPTVNCTAFGRADGLLSGSTAGDGAPAATLLSDGKVITATDRGFAIIDPRTIRTNARAPAVIVESVTADDRRLPLAASVTVPAGTTRIEIKYTALSLLAPERQRFRYRLTGLDPSWVDADHQRTATFTRLAPGTYDFRVIACNNDGVWNEQGAVLGLHILPRFYETLLFRLGGGAAVVLAAIWTVRLIVKRRYERRLAQLEQQHALDRERSRIARDLHDDLGAGLTEAGMLADALVETAPAGLNDQLSGLAWRIRRLATDLSGIVWTMNAKHSSIEDLAQFLRRYSERLFRNTHTRCVVSGLESMPDLPISPNVRHQILAAVKEALNNVIKHAHASEAQVTFKYVNEGFEVWITDDGVGFELPAGQDETYDGNGLRNMRTRLQEIGGALEIVSSRAAGTRVILRAPVSRVPPA